MRPQSLAPPPSCSALCQHCASPAGRESGSPWLSPDAPPLWWAACLNPLQSACCQMRGLQSKQDKGLFLDQGQTSQTTSICQVGLGQNVSSFGQHRARGPGQTLTPQTQVCKKSPISNFLPKCLLGLPMMECSLPRITQNRGFCSPKDEERASRGHHRLKCTWAMEAGGPTSWACPGPGVSAQVNRTSLGVHPRLVCRDSLPLGGSGISWGVPSGAGIGSQLLSAPASLDPLAA